MEQESFGTRGLVCKGMVFAGFWSLNAGRNAVQRLRTEFALGLTLPLSKPGGSSATMQDHKRF